MLVLVTYDVATSDRQGRRRLRRVARTCLDYGQRVQNSVFECDVTPALFAQLRKRILDIIEPKEDSIRFYFLGKNWKRRVEHHGAKPAVDLDGPLIV